MQQNFNGLEVTVHKTRDNKQWYMTVEEVAKGYGVTIDTVHKHISRHNDEIRDDIEKGWTNSLTPGGEQRKVVVYREGVLGVVK